MKFLALLGKTKMRFARKVKQCVNTATKRIRTTLRLWLGISELQTDVVIAGDLARTADDRCQQLSRWLRETPGVDGIATDLHLGDRWGGWADSMVIICSRLRGGMVRIVPVRFDGLEELRRFIQMTESLLEPDMYFWDAPIGLNEMIKDETEKIARRNRQRSRRVSKGDYR